MPSSKGHRHKALVVQIQGKLSLPSEIKNKSPIWATYFLFYEFFRLAAKIFKSIICKMDICP